MSSPKGGKESIPSPVGHPMSTPDGKGSGVSPGFAWHSLFRRLSSESGLNKPISDYLHKRFTKKQTAKAFPKRTLWSRQDSSALFFPICPLICFNTKISSRQELGSWLIFFILLNFIPEANFFVNQFFF